MESLEKFGDGYCLKIKLKDHPLFKNDIYVICLENEELRNFWIKSFSAEIDTSGMGEFKDMPNASAVIRNPFETSNTGGAFSLKSQVALKNPI